MSVRDLRVHFSSRGRWGSARKTIRAVDDISFDIPRGKTLGLVGESGCGKTTTGRAILRLVRATSGAATFDGVNVFSLDAAEMRRLRRRLQIVFQDPVGSLNPRMTVGSIIGEGLKIHRMARGQELRARVGRVLERVGLHASDADRYPHEFSGGQRQRVGIARAIALEPEFIVCDEPVSALDVSVQSQVLNLLSDLQRDLGLTYLFIAHNLAIVEHISDAVAVMYLGKIAEIGPANDVYAHAHHPYTHALLASVPEATPGKQSAYTPLAGEVPSPANPPPGCTFHPRCPRATDLCQKTAPALEVKDGMAADHRVACHHASE